MENSYVRTRLSTSLIPIIRKQNECSFRCHRRQKSARKFWPRNKTCTSLHVGFFHFITGPKLMRQRILNQSSIFTSAKGTCQCTEFRLSRNNWRTRSHQIKIFVNRSFGWFSSFASISSFTQKFVENFGVVFILWIFSFTVFDYLIVLIQFLFYPEICFRNSRPASVSLLGLSILGSFLIQQL